MDDRIEAMSEGKDKDLTKNRSEDISFSDNSADERYELILNKLIQYLYSGNIQKGKKIPSENQMAKILCVSRGAIREVYRALNLFGLLESRRGEGTFLRNTNNEMFIQVMMLMLYNDNSTLRDIMELRKVLEIGTAEKAAMNRTDEDVRKLKDILRRMEKHFDDGNMLSALDAELHNTIGHCSGNPLLTSIQDIVSGLVIMSIKEHWNYIIFDKSKATKRITFEQHKELVDSIIRQKPYIAKVIAQEHISFVEESLECYKKEDDTNV